MAKKKYRIPREKLPEAISLCIGEIEDYIIDAETLINKGSLKHAVIMVQFACEELGKANILKTKHNTSKPNDMIEVKDSLFKDHKPKTNECFNLIGRDLQIIYPGGFERGAFTRRAAYITELMDHVTRTQCSFIGWDEHENDWMLFPRIDQDRLKKIIEAIKRKLSDLI